MHTLGAVDVAGSWWVYLGLFVAVAASWAGVPFIGATALGAAGVAASQGKPRPGAGRRRRHGWQARWAA